MSQKLSHKESILGHRVIPARRFLDHAAVFDRNRPWATQISCSKCGSKWFWCRVCNKGQIPKNSFMSKPNQLNSHGKLKSHVASLKHNVPDRLDADLAEVEHFFVCVMVSMISRMVMKGPTISDEEIIQCDRLIRYFLSKLDAFLKKYVRIDGGSSKKGKIVVEWIDKYNFISLLAISESTRRYGSHRPLWDGDGKGEAGLPLVKLCIQSLKGKWARRCADRYGNWSTTRNT
jgi:hypothetical protein